MQEQFLHYVWKYQKFDHSKLKLTDGRNLIIFYSGNHNQDSGPDFEEARIKIDTMEWAGQIEIHVNSSDWIRHNHQIDPAYKNVILHVVWDHDQEIHIGSESIPTLELKSIVDPQLVGKYSDYLKSNHEIPCSNQIHSVSELTIGTMRDRVLVERLKSKAEQILECLHKNSNDWEDVTYQALSASFGFSTNKHAFIRLAELLPFSVIRRIQQNQIQTEALLFGMAGFLENPNDDYGNTLKNEFEFIRKKFQLDDGLSRNQWKFGKLRPANFPTVRLAQFSSVLHRQPHLFTTLTETSEINSIKKILKCEVSDYWQKHYDFEKERKKVAKVMGEKSQEIILINTVAPLLAAYAQYCGDYIYMEQATSLLESLPAEKNRITKKWADLGLEIQSAFDSQAVIQLIKEYCLNRKCLQCNVGVEILNK